MAIRAANDAFRDFLFRLRLALGVTDVNLFAPIDMVKIESAGIGESAIATSGLLLNSIEPRAKSVAPLACGLPIASPAISLGTLVISPTILRIVRTVARATVRLADLVGIAFAPTLSCLSLTVSFFFGIHGSIVTGNQIHANQKKEQNDETKTNSLPAAADAGGGGDV